MLKLVLNPAGTIDPTATLCNILSPNTIRVKGLAELPTEMGKCANLGLLGKNMMPLLKSHYHHLNGVGGHDGITKKVGNRWTSGVKMGRTPSGRGTSWVC